MTWRFFRGLVRCLWGGGGALAPRPQEKENLRWLLPWTGLQSNWGRRIEKHEAEGICPQYLQPSQEEGHGPQTPPQASLRLLSLQGLGVCQVKTPSKQSPDFSFEVVKMPFIGERGKPREPVWGRGGELVWMWGFSLSVSPQRSFSSPELRESPASCHCVSGCQQLDAFASQYFSCCSFAANQRESEAIDTAGRRLLWKGACPCGRDKKMCHCRG